MNKSPLAAEGTAESQQLCRRRRTTQNRARKFSKETKTGCYFGNWPQCSWHKATEAMQYVLTIPPPNPWLRVIHTDDTERVCLMLWETQRQWVLKHAAWAIVHKGRNHVDQFGNCCTLDDAVLLCRHRLSILIIQIHQFWIIFKVRHWSNS